MNFNHSSQSGFASIGYVLMALVLTGLITGALLMMNQSGSAVSTEANQLAYLQSSITSVHSQISRCLNDYPGAINGEGTTYENYPSSMTPSTLSTPVGGFGSLMALKDVECHGARAALCPSAASTDACPEARLYNYSNDTSISPPTDLDGAWQYANTGEAVVIIPPSLSTKILTKLKNGILSASFPTTSGCRAYVIASNVSIETLCGYE